MIESKHEQGLIIITPSVCVFLSLCYSELNWRQVDEIVQLLGTSTSRTAWLTY